MRHVRQRGRKDCGHACVAMVLGVPLRDVKRASRADSLELGLSAHELVTILRGFAPGRWKCLMPRTLAPLSSWEFDEGVVGIALVRDPEDDDEHHWVVVKGGHVHDPRHERGGRLSRHPRRAWLLHRYVYKDAREPAAS